MENTNQPPISTLTPPQVPVEPTVSPNKSNLLVISLIIIEVVTLLVAGYFAYQFSLLKRQIVLPQTTPSPISNFVSPSPLPSSNETSTWKTYVDKDVTFNYPADWIQKATQLTGSGNNTEFISADKLFTFTLTEKGNYNQTTGKPFNSIDEYLHFPDPVTYSYDSVQANGVMGKQYLPRAGSEQDSAVAFLSFDKSFFYLLELDQSHDASPDKVQESQKIFSQILSTFKIIGTTNGGAAGQYCAGANNLACPAGFACKLNTVNKPELGGKCVSESETNP